MERAGGAMAAVPRHGELNAHVEARGGWAWPSYPRNAFAGSTAWAPTRLCWTVWAATS